MVEEQKDEQQAAEDQRKAEAEALAADPIGGKPPIDVAQERAAAEAEPPGYVDPEAQKPVEGYAPDPADVENPPGKEPKKAAKSAVTRGSVKKG